jgi:hypothetical protein
MALAEKELNIPVLLEVEDFLQGTDERMLATYVSYFRNLIRNNREVRAVFVVRRACGNCVRVVVT